MHRLLNTDEPLAGHPVQGHLDQRLDAGDVGRAFAMRCEDELIVLVCQVQ